MLNNQVLPIFTSQLQELARGVEMYCEPLGRTIKVFAFTTLIVGDRPRRTSISNNECANNNNLSYSFYV